jgi:hypothetical protein
MHSAIADGVKTAQRWDGECEKDLKVRETDDRDLQSTICGGNSVARFAGSRLIG